MKLEYARFRRSKGPDLTRPIIPILLRNPCSAISHAIATEALVDSGADFCVFSGELGELLGIDVTAGEMRTVAGVVAGETRPLYFHPIEIEVGPYGYGRHLRVWAGFMPDLADSGHGILGRNGFFSGLTFVKFRDWDDELELGKKRR